MEAPTSTNYLMPRARRRPVAAAGAGLRPPAAAFEVRLEHGHLTIVEGSDSVHLDERLDVTREAPACGGGRRRPAAAFEVRLGHDHLAIVEENARGNPAVPGQLRSGASPTTVKAIYFSSLKLLTAAASGRVGALRSVREGFGPSAMNCRHWPVGNEPPALAVNR